jgi:hypothetical protein
MRKRIFVAFPIDYPQLYKPLEEAGYELIFGTEPSPPMAASRKKYSEEEVIEKTQQVDAILASPRLSLTSN